MTDTEMPVVLPQDATLVDPATLELHPANPRMGDVGAIVESITSNGFFDPLVVQISSRRVLDGNHRLLAARHLGMPLVPVAWVDVDDDRALRILLVANRANDLASYNDHALAALLTDMAQQTPLGLAGTGFADDDLDRLLADLAGPPRPYVAPSVPQEPLAGHAEYRCPVCSHEWSGSPFPE